MSFSVPNDAAAAARWSADSTSTRLGVSDLEITSPTLDDVFFLLATTGAPA